MMLGSDKLFNACMYPHMKDVGVGEHFGHNVSLDFGTEGVLEKPVRVFNTERTTLKKIDDVATMELESYGVPWIMDEEMNKLEGKKFTSKATIVHDYRKYQLVSVERTTEVVLPRQTVTRIEKVTRLN